MEIKRKLVYVSLSQSIYCNINTSCFVYKKYITNIFIEDRAVSLRDLIVFSISDNVGHKLDSTVWVWNCTLSVPSVLLFLLYSSRRYSKA